MRTHCVMSSTNFIVTLNSYLQDDDSMVEGLEREAEKGLFIYLYTRETQCRAILSKIPPDAINCQTRKIVSALAPISTLQDTQRERSRKQGYCRQ